MKNLFYIGAITLFFFSSLKVESAVAGMTRSATETGCYKTERDGSRRWSVDYCTQSTCTPRNQGYWYDGKCNSTPQSKVDTAEVCPDPNDTSCHGAAAPSAPASSNDTPTTDYCSAEHLKLCESNSDRSPEECRKAYNCDPSTNTQASSDATAKTEDSCYQAEVDKCQEAVDAAKNNCDTSKDTGINNAANAGSDVASALGALASAGSNLACGKIGALGQTTNAAVLAFQQNCGSKRNTCLDACHAAQAKKVKCNPSDKKEVLDAATTDTQQYIKTCENLASSLQSANQSLANMVQLGTAAQCAAGTAGTQFCSQFPTNPTCVAQLAKNCSSPDYAAANLACVCVSAPTSPACVTAQKEGGALLAGGGGLPVTADSGGGAMPPQEQMADPVIGKVDPQHLAAEPGGAGGGGGGSPAGRGGNQFDKNNRGGPVDKPSLLQGFNGGQTGGGLGGFIGGVAGAVRGLFGGSAQKEKGPDLAKFLPKAGVLGPGRGIAGTTGPDGITGPHSDMWLKVKNRYQAQVNSFLP